MIRSLCGCRAAALGLVAVSLIAAVPVPGRAAWLGYRNDTKTPVIVQVVQVVNVQGRAIVRRGAPHQLYAGDVAWDFILQPGAKTITVYDAKDPKRVLVTGQVVVAGMDLFYALQLEPPPKPPKEERPPKKPREERPPPPPRFKLVPTSPPNPPPGMRR